MAKSSNDEVCAYRGTNGDTVTINSSELLVGDVILVQAGNKLAVDCILLSGTDIHCDEASLTGEPDEVPKIACTQETYRQNPQPFMFAKTLVTQGQGVALVCAVGAKTRSGMAEEKLNIEAECTPL